MNKLIALTALSLSALATPMMAQAETENPGTYDVTICSGAIDGAYHKLGSMIERSIKSQDRNNQLNVTHLDTLGSLENVDMMADGECDIVVLQGDVSSFEHNGGRLAATNKVFAAHTETLIYLANKANGFTDLESIEGREDVLLVVADGSGSYGTVRNFAKEDSGYKTNFDKMVLADSAYDAAMIAAQGSFNGKTVAGALLVTTPKASTTFREIHEDFGNKLVVGALSDGDFDDATNAMGHKLYNTVDFPSGNYPKFGKHDTFGDQDTLAVSAVVEFDATHIESRIGDRREARKVTAAIKKGIAKALRNVQ